MKATISGIFYLIVFLTASLPLRTAAQTDTGNSVQKFYISCGLQGYFIQPSGLNAALLDKDSKAYIGSMQLAGAFGLGLETKGFILGFEYVAGGLDAVTDQHIVTTKFKELKYQMGFDFDLGKNVYLTTRVGFGIMNFEIHSTLVNNQLSFDSLVKQSKAGTVGTQEVSLYTNNNLYVEPQIGIMFRQHSSLFNHCTSSIGFQAGYQVNTGPTTWLSGGGTRISDVPLTLSQLPYVGVLI
jgi:hypothetical protein